MRFWVMGFVVMVDDCGLGLIEGGQSGLGYGFRDLVFVDDCGMGPGFCDLSPPPNNLATQFVGGGWGLWFSSGGDGGGFGGGGWCWSFHDGDSLGMVKLWVLKKMKKMMIGG
ncbi:hypothetical protein QYF36_015164 [Acer negundo]|nr:hypothetical protein QYF36_015164 [Acer negundo]